MGYPEDPDRVRLTKGESAPVELPYEGYQPEQYLDPYTGQPMGGASPEPAYPHQPYGVPAYPDQDYQQYPAQPDQQYPAQPYPGYPAGPYGQGYPAGPYGQGYPVAPRTNGMAIGALVASIAGATMCGIGALVGAVLGHIAMGQIKKSGEQGQGMALAAVIIGWIIGGLGLLFWIFYVIVIVATASSPT